MRQPKMKIYRVARRGYSHIEHSQIIWNPAREMNAQSLEDVYNWSKSAL
jgi:hypothetical protein